MSTITDHELDFIKANYTPVAGDRTKIIARNLCENPRCESLTGYTGPNGTAISLDTSTKHSGTNSIKASFSSGALTTQQGLGRSYTQTLKDNTIYTLSVWVFVPGTNTANVVISVQGTGTAIGNHVGPPSSTRDAWEQMTFTFTTSGASTATVSTYVLNGGVTGASDVVYVDDITLVEGTIAKDFSGASLNAYWEGTPNASASVLTDPANTPADDLLFNYWASQSGLAPADSYSLADHKKTAMALAHTPVIGDKIKVIGKNLVPNPNFETDASNWTLEQCSLVTSTAHAKSGLQSGLLTALNASSPPHLNVIDFDGVIVDPNTKYYCTFQSGFGSVAGSSTSMFVIFKDKKGNTLSHDPVPLTVSSIPTNSWVRTTGIVSTPPNAYKMRVALVILSAPLNYTCYIDECFIGEATDTYFDGNSTDAYWEGTVNKSVSVLTDPANTPLHDLEFSYYAGLSGLMPVDSYSLQDHKDQYLRTQLGI